MRKLLPHEIDVRVGTVSKNKPKAMLLLYKDSRCDMALLDETYGSENWQCEFVFLNKKNVITVKKNKNLEVLDRYEESLLFCKIGVYNEKIKEWVWKQSNGVESQGTGSDDPNNKKGEASDSFKRAGFMWGIGRELYEWKDLWIDYDKDNDKYERYSVSEIEYNDNGEPKDLVIVNKANEIVYELRNGYYKKQPTNKKVAKKQETKTNKKQTNDTVSREDKEIAEQVKDTNTEHYRELIKNIIFELEKMKSKDELVHNIGSFQEIAKNEIDNYIKNDIKTTWSRVQFGKENDKEFENYILIDTDQAFKDILLNIISVYGNTEDESGDY